LVQTFGFLLPRRRHGAGGGVRHARRRRHRAVRHARSEVRYFVDAAVERWVSAIVAAGPGAIRIQKRLVSDWERMSIADAVRQGIAAVVEARGTDEPRRLMEAFVERQRARKQKG